jgi:outer membrane usher protein
VRLAGFQIRRDFGTRPDVITVPTPTLSATAAAPSTLDVLLGTSTILSRQVGAGPIQISDLPIPQGQGQARLILRDALGGEQEVTAAYFASPELLRPGLLDFSVEAGFARRNFGILSDDYEPSPVGSASARYGVSDALTIQGHTEDGNGLANLGAGAVVRVGDFGAVSVAAADSQFKGRQGGLFAAAFNTRLSKLTLSAQAQATIGDYRDLAAVTLTQQWMWNGMDLGQAPKALFQVAASTPISLALLDRHGDLPTLGLSYSEIQNRVGPSRSVLNASVQYRITPRISLQASVYASQSGSTDNGFFVSLSFPLGHGRDADAGVESTGGEVRPFAEASQEDRPEVGSAAWRLRVDGGHDGDIDAEGVYRSDYGRLTALASRTEGVDQVEGRIDGAVVWLGRPMLAPDRIDGSFALVDVGAPNVEVRQQGRPIGFSDSQGWMLASDLLPYEINRIDIDVEALSLDFSTRQTQAIVSPPLGAGALVRFGVAKAAPQARVTLKLENGDYVPAGALASLNGGANDIVVGYDGEVFLPELLASNIIRADLGNNEACTAKFNIDLASKVRLHVAQLVCRAATAPSVVVAGLAGAVPDAVGPARSGPGRLHGLGD